MAAARGMMQASGALFYEQHHLIAAAEGGDVRAMVLLAEHFLGSRYGRDGQRVLEAAERWAREAAELGDPEGMHCLSGICTSMALGPYRSGLQPMAEDHKDPDRERWSDEGERWKERAAEAGHEGAIWALAADLPWNSAEKRERWLRHGAALGHRRLRGSLLRLLREQQRFEDAEPWQRAAAEDGDSHEQLQLGQRLVEQSHLDQAERWFRAAAGSADVWASLEGARELARLLVALGHVEEAEQWLRKIADSDWRRQSLDAARELNRLCAEQGRVEEAARWRRRVTEIENVAVTAPSLPGSHSAQMAEVALTAVVTTAVLPFVQVLVSKAGEDAYAQARALIRRLPLGRRDAMDSESGAVSHSRQQEARFVIVDDPDTGITLYLSSEASDEALRALAAFDLSELTGRRPDEGHVRLIWHQATGTWRVRGEAGPPAPPAA
ncbi:tetratricopeptide repeat protein [Streptomyces xanthophaeus]|uniref:tetratricopeptide repeat protein n=1 Tax=Streptomyces xanthophaeus TaxID=67385 RepID=UPI0037203474